MLNDQMSGRDWNEGHPDHEGEMAVSQLHRIEEMAAMLLELIGEDDDLPGWVQYKISRAYTDLNDAFGYIESKGHESEATHGMQEGKKKKGSCSGCKGKNPGLWCNICKKRARGERPAKPGQKGYPKTLNIESKNLREMITKLVELELSSK